MVQDLTSFITVVPQEKADVGLALVDNTAREAGALSTIPLVVFGNSFHVPDAAIHRQGRHYTDRVVSILGMSNLTNRAVGGATAGRIARKVLKAEASDIQRARALVGLTVIGNNILIGNTPSNRKAVREAARSIFATVTAEAKISATSAAFVYSPGWQGFEAGSISGQWPATATVGSYFEFSFAGAAADIILTARSDFSGVVRFTEGATVLATVDTSGMPSEDSLVPLVTKLRLGAGNHTIRGTLIGGTGALVDGALIPSANPTTAYVINELVPDGTRYGEGVDWKTTRAALWEELKSVAKDYPTIKLIDLGLIGWDARVLTADGLHANDPGQDFILRQVVPKLSAIGYSVGLGHVLDQAKPYPSEYSPPPAPAVPDGGSSGTSFS